MPADPDPKSGHAHGVEVWTTVSPDGAELDLSAHGAQVLGWRPASGGERLWLSSQAGPPVLRGGIPVVFPQFSDRGPLPKHGLARDRAWQVVAVGGGRAMLELRDDQISRQVWPQAFCLELTAEVVADRLEVDLTVSNPGEQAWSFTAALHSFLAVTAANETRVRGVGGHPGQDQARGLAPVQVPAGDLAITPPRDLAVRGACGPRRLLGGAYGDLDLTTGGFLDTVIWHPAEQNFPDIPAEEAPGFVCVEPAALTPVVLEPGGTWRGSMRLVAAAASEAQAGAPNGVGPNG